MRLMLNLIHEYWFHDMLFFFFKQKTAYEMRISDWSSDVCSSDLRTVADHQLPFAPLSVLDLHRRAQAFRQALLQTADVRVDLDFGFRCFLAAQPLTHQGFGLAHGQPTCDNVPRAFDLLFRRQT